MKNMRRNNLFPTYHFELNVASDGAYGVSVCQTVEQIPIKVVPAKKEKVSTGFSIAPESSNGQTKLGKLMYIFTLPCNFCAFY